MWESVAFKAPSSYEGPDKADVPISNRKINWAPIIGRYGIRCGQ